MYIIYLHNVLVADAAKFHSGWVSEWVPTYPPSFKLFSVWKIFPHISDRFEISCFEIRSKSIFSLSLFVSLRCQYYSTMLWKNLWNIIMQAVNYLIQSFCSIRISTALSVTHNFSLCHTFSNLCVQFCVWFVVHVCL